MSQSRARQWLGIGLVLFAIAALLLWLMPRETPASTSLETAELEADASVSVTAVAPKPARVTTSTSADSGTVEPTNGAVVARFEWGSGDGSLGRSSQPEGNPEGPMSLTVGPDGTVVVLDQVNGRLVRLDASGKRLSSVPVPLQAPQDVVMTKDGTALVLDRLVDKAVSVIGPDGKPKGELPIEGKGLTEGGASTGLFTDGDDVLVEREHGDLVRIGSTKGAKDTTRGEVPGRPSRDGSLYLTATLVDAQAGQCAVTAVERSSLEHRFTRQLGFGQPLWSLVLLDSDASGLAYVGGLVEAPGSTPDVPRAAIVVLCLDGHDGRVFGRVAFPANQLADESFKELVVEPEGTILFLRRTSSGAQLERHRCGP